MSKELAAQARKAALDRLQRATGSVGKQLNTVEQLEQDGTLSKEEADAERSRLDQERAAAKEAYSASLERIAAGDVETELAAVAAAADRANKAPKRARPDKAGEKEGGPAAPSAAQTQALRELRVQQLKQRAEQAARALQAAAEGDAELVAFEQRLEQLATEEKKKGPSKHFTSIAWRKACVAMVEVFNFGVLRSARKMAELLDEEGAPSSWEKQFASLKNWRRAFAAGKLGTKYGLLGDDTVEVGGPDERIVRLVAPGDRPGPKRLFAEVERKLKEWIIDCQKKKQPLTRSAVWDEALKLDASMYGGRDAEGWHIKMSRWYYKFLQREDLFIKEKETGGRGRPRSRQQPPHLDHAAHDIGRENEGGGERVQEEEETAAKRPKRPAPCYNDHQLRKLEHFYMMGRDRTDYDHMAAAVTGLNGARHVSRQDVQQWFASRITGAPPDLMAPMHQHQPAWSGLVDAASMAASHGAYGPSHGMPLQMDPRIGMPVSSPAYRTVPPPPPPPHAMY